VQAHEEPTEAAKIIRDQLINTNIDRIDETEMDGIYELTVNDGIFYYHPESKILFLGELWNSQKINLTQERKNELITARLQDLPLGIAIKIGKGPNIVIEVVDPDCTFCRKTHKYFSERDDLTRYIFLFPILKLHPNAEKKARHILCAKDKQKAYEDALTGKFDNAFPEPCEEEGVTILLNQHKQVGKRLNVRGTPALWINNQFVNGADFKRIASLLGDDS